VTTPGEVAFGDLPRAPFTTTLAPPDLEGKRLMITGRVYASDCKTLLPGALVKVWHTDTNGEYDETEPYILRGQTRTDDHGRYKFRTIRPGHYGTTGSQQPRPAHIHYQITYGGTTVGTRLLFADDPYLTNDLRLDSRQVISLTQRVGPDGPILYGTFDIVLPVEAPAPTPTPEKRL
jgi:catechol 1,2-dioxygenase